MEKNEQKIKTALYRRLRKTEKRFFQQKVGVGVGNVL